MMTTPPAGSEKWTDEQREVWRRLVEAPEIEELPEEILSALVILAAYFIEGVPSPFLNPLLTGHSADERAEHFFGLVAMTLRHVAGRVERIEASP